MFTPKPSRLLALAILVAAGGLSGCQKRPGPEQLGEVITEVPERLNKPFPLPELEEPEKATEEVGK